MVAAIVACTVSILLALFRLAWWLSSRLTAQDIRLTLIEKRLRLNGYGDKRR